MSELFTYKGDDEHYFIKTKNKQYTGDEVADLLNALSEENNKLKEINKDKEQDVLHLYKKNEQLHQKNTKLIAKIDFLEKIIDGDL